MAKSKKATPTTFEEISNPNKPVLVRNEGEPFAVDLQRYGYGSRWPTGAVYTIPTGVYVQCLKDGMKGVLA